MVDQTDIEQIIMQLLLKICLELQNPWACAFNKKVYFLHGLL